MKFFSAATRPLANQKPQGRGCRVLLAAATALLLPLAVQTQAEAQESGPVAADVTFYTAPSYGGISKTLTLAPDQPYAAIPFVGDELNAKIASLRADPQVGVILFQRPYFASRDDACGPNLGTLENPDAWWLGLTADFEPPSYSDQAYEAPEMQDDDYSSLIAYRRDLGPPPGFLLLERRSYYNRACERTADQSYFNRIFIPIPNPPQREACTDLSVPASAYGAGADAPRFVRVTEAIALLPDSFSDNYRGQDHRFVLTVFDGANCSGSSISLPNSADGRSATYRLSDFDFDRKARSVMIRYQRGPLDRYMSEAAEPAQAALPPTTAPAAAPTAPSTAEAPAQRTSIFGAAPGTGGATSSSQQPLSSPPVSGSPAPAAGGLQPAPPSAPSQAQQQALQPLPRIEPLPVEPTPQRPSGAQEETFRFPVHQVYRLNFCMDGEQGCGEPAANSWCQDRGFSRAVRWAQEDNIGALYPTVFIGSGAICDKFLCDGFEEITCAR